MRSVRGTARLALLPSVALVGFAAAASAWGAEGVQAGGPAHLQSSVRLAPSGNAAETRHGGAVRLAQAGQGQAGQNQPGQRQPSKQTKDQQPRAPAAADRPAAAPEPAATGAAPSVSNSLEDLARRLRERAGSEETPPAQIASPD